MAYSYDNRYYQSDRHDPHFGRSRDQGGYSRFAPKSTSPGATHPSLTMMRSLRSDNYSYDPRYSYSSPPVPPRTPTYPSGPEYQRRARWPPAPSVEDEVDALTKEFASTISISDLSSGEAKSRGTVDQEPILVEVEQPKSNENDERRFVLVPEAGRSSSSAREGRRRSFAERGNIPHLKTDMDEPALFTRREPSPYAYSKLTKVPSARSSAEYFLSPDVITPTSSNVPRSVPQQDGWNGDRNQNSNPTSSSHGRYDSVTSPRASKTELFDESDLDIDESTNLRIKRKPARYSFVKGELQRDDLRTSLNEPVKETRSTPRSPNPRLANESFVSSGSASGPGSSKSATPPPQSPRSSNSYLHNVSLPRQVPSSRPAPVETTYARSPRKYQDGGPGSPLANNPHVPQSPPRSPNLSQTSAMDSPPRSKPGSGPGSRSSSRATSPLAFTYSNSLPPPSPPRINARDMDWTASFPPVRQDRPRSESRHRRQETIPMPLPPRIDVQSPSPARPLKALPYPVDNMSIELFMPSEENYQFYPTSPPIPQSPSPSPTYPRAPNEISSPVTNSSRPPVASRHTADDDVPRITRVISNPTRSVSSYDSRRKDRKPTTFAFGKPLPPCPRSEYTNKYIDWYTLENCPNFDVCPSCYEAVFADNQFADYFKQTRQYEKPAQRKCDFSSPWVRLAWLLTVKQQRKSLDLIYRLATICEIEKECPGSQEVAGTWYGLLDRGQYGDLVTGFAICPCDLKQLEALFPSLRGYFTRIYPADPRKKFICSLRTNSRRFPKYLDMLVDLDEKASRDRRSPDMRPFIDFAKENAYKHECPRDNLVLDQAWHFIPQLPEFTVCEECYDDVVWPAIKDGSKLAAEFNRTVQFVPGEEAAGGTSCQLYSPRMRRVWQAAVEDDDYTYLAKKAHDRKQVEVDLQRQHKILLRMLDGRGEWSWQSGGSVPEGVERERLKAEVGDIARKWRDWE
jgi:hypothetical protein